MKAKPEPRTRLIADAVAGDWLGGPAGEFARRAAAHARSRRRRARITAAGAGFAALLAIAAALGSHSRPAEPARYEIISEADLLAALRDQPLLILPESPPDRRYVILNR